MAFLSSPRHEICIFRFLNAVPLYFKRSCRSLFGKRCRETSVKTFLFISSVKNYKNTCIVFTNVPELVT